MIVTAEKSNDAVNAEKLMKRKLSKFSWRKNKRRE